MKILFIELERLQPDAVVFYSFYFIYLISNLRSASSVENDSHVDCLIYAIYI